MVLWRISNHASLTGDGGLRTEGRWHPLGSRVGYCTTSPAGALLEMLVRAGLGPERDAVHDRLDGLELLAPQRHGQRHVLLDDLLAQPHAVGGQPFGLDERLLLGEEQLLGILGDGGHLHGRRLAREVGGDGGLGLGVERGRAGVDPRRAGEHRLAERQDDRPVLGLGARAVEWHDDEAPGGGHAAEARRPGGAVTEDDVEVAQQAAVAVAHGAPGERGGVHVEGHGTPLPAPRI